MNSIASFIVYLKLDLLRVIVGIRTATKCEEEKKTNCISMYIDVDKGLKSVSPIIPHDIAKIEKEILENMGANGLV
ncbi:MAG: hypothetical protein HQK50_00490 [Oligoflexia bacterium]|nr:hypothetical protein [Oligoflexia bacterium]MBF0364013.1 hypothetical protein [Oligoflexia bacterium]